MTDTERFKKNYFHGMLHNGVYLPPAAFESWFLSNALTYDDLDATIQATRQAPDPSRVFCSLSWQDV